MPGTSERPRQRYGTKIRCSADSGGREVGTTKQTNEWPSLALHGCCQSSSRHNDPQSSQHRASAWNVLTGMNWFEAMQSPRPYPASIARLPDGADANTKAPAGLAPGSCPLISRKEQSLWPHPPILCRSGAAHHPGLPGRN